MTTSDEAQARIDAWMERLRVTLAARGVEAEEIRETVWDLRHHVAEALEETVEGRPSEADAERVLAALGAPEGWETPDLRSAPLAFEGLGVGAEAPRAPEGGGDGGASALGDVAFAGLLASVPSAFVVGALASALGHDGGALGWVFFVGWLAVCAMVGGAGWKTPRGRLVLVAAPSLVVGAMALARWGA